MTTLLIVAWGAFAWTMSTRLRLLATGRGERRFDHLATRLRGTWTFAFRQEKMDYYNPAGWAHRLIFIGFVVLLLRTLMLWARGFDPAFNLWVLAPAEPLGAAYEFAKDCVATLVLCGTLVFFYYRLVVKPKRMALSGEGLLILVIIATMMIADMVYDGAALVLHAKSASFCMPRMRIAHPATCDAVARITAPIAGEIWDGQWAAWPSPAGSLFGTLFFGMPAQALVWIARAGFWTHSTLVLLFLNLLPRSKHFHVITAIPNVFLRSLQPAGRLTPMAESAEKLMEKVGAAAETGDPLAQPIGIARVEHFTWKAILDFYTCTECGRCSDNCPAYRTGKVLSPKHFTLDLRDHLYGREKELIGSATGSATASVTGSAPTSSGAAGIAPIDLVPNVIVPEVLWACTTCRACEEQCPVLISYVDKIVDMRRSLVLVKGEFPHELAKPFQGMESNGNPWNLARSSRPEWAEGLDVATMAERPRASVLFWVGCAASYDDRAKRIARATAKLLKQGGVDFAILGQEETCTGDPARRAGNEFLFSVLAEGNAATISGYRAQGGVRTVVTTCPHCFNTLKNEYPDFGLRVDVVHHTDFLLGLVAEGRLVPRNPVQGRVAYHDSCYLGRYNGVYDSPRELLKRIPGVELVEVEYWNKQRGLCCGAGGAQMWMEEQNQDRVSGRRALQLIDTGAKTIASACPFCMTMLTDGIKSKNVEDEVKPFDVAELLERSCQDPLASSPSLPTLPTLPTLGGSAEVPAPAGALEEKAPVVNGT
jgi:Fe-S oxidoreductase